MRRSIIRVLVVDRYEPWRQFVYSTLHNQPELEVIGEAWEGSEAVEKAQELQPDLILLDVSLPAINGIEVARRIRLCAPQTKILFVSENRSTDIAEAALNTGASGYVVKSDVGSQLLPAIKAVLEGQRFLSTSLGGPFFSNENREQSPDRFSRKAIVAPITPQNVVIRHEIELYSDDAALVDSFARLIGTILRAGNVAIVVATESHRADILERLQADAVNVDIVTKQRRYIPLDAAKVLSAFMVQGMPDPARCARALDDLIRGVDKNATGDGARIAICGECGPTLLATGHVAAAIRLEHLWDEITRTHGVDTLCGYLWGAFPNGESSRILARICAEHSAIQGRALGYQQIEPRLFR